MPFLLSKGPIEVGQILEDRLLSLPECFCKVSTTTEELSLADCFVFTLGPGCSNHDHLSEVLRYLTQRETT